MSALRSSFITLKTSEQENFEDEQGMGVPSLCGNDSPSNPVVVRREIKRYDEDLAYGESLPTPTPTMGMGG